MHATKDRLLDEAVAMLLEHGYNDLGVQALLDRTGVPKGSFYHHFPSKEAMALEAVDRYTALGHQLLEVTLAPDGRPPRARVRAFFERMRGLYASQGYLGCLLGALGQELSGTNDVFRRRIDECLSSIADCIAACYEEDPAADPPPSGLGARDYAYALVTAWEGAALRCRLARGPAPLDAFLAFYFPTSRVGG